MKKRYYYGLDFLKGLLCVWIFLFHYEGMCEYRFLEGSCVNFLFSKGSIAVEAFFMISGFCMASRWKNGETGGYQASNFTEYFMHYYRRFIFLSILTMPAAIIKQVEVYHAGLDGAPNLSEALLDIFCIRAGWGLSTSPPYNGPFWFIDVLLMMYLLFWLVANLSKGDREKFLLGCGLLTIVGLFVLSSKTEYFVFDDRYAGRGLSTFFIGCILYEIYNKIDVSTKCKRRRTEAILILFTCVLGFPYFIGNDKIVGLYGTKYSFIYILVVFPCAVLLFSMLNTDKRILQRICKTIGAFSTSLFIWHYPILTYIWGKDVLAGGALNRISGKSFIIIAVICFGWALFSSIFIEDKLYSYLKNSIVRKQKKKQLTLRNNDRL